MRFVVIGPGALGCLFAATLSADHKHEVWLLDHNPERAAILNRDGIILQHGADEQRCFIRATDTGHEINDSDCILLCVKSHQVPAAITNNKTLFETSPLTIAFQNGIGHLDTIAANLPVGQWAIGVTSQGANLVEPGHVRHGGAGLTSLGFLHPPAPSALDRLQQVAQIFRQSNIETTLEPRIKSKIWQKLLVNVGINALTAIHNCPNGELLQSEKTCQRMRRAIREGAAVAEALAIPLDHEPISLAMQVCRDTAGNLSSMLQDIRNRRRTEIDAINGAIVREGDRLGIAVPENKALLQAIKELENSRLTDSA